ncbi:MAG TPA: LamG domain-containing protein [Thermoanaerobaculia bacterium]|nr:LamG domain-containing protein [Thermoanaerobaculia bacterium]
MLGDLAVRGDRDTSGDRTSTLIIPGPAEVRFNSGAGLTIGRDTGQHPGYAGRLQTTGVTFKGNTTSPSAGFWKGIYFADTTTGGGQTFLDACRVDEAGGHGALGAVVVNATSPELRNGTSVHDTASTGLYLTVSTDSSVTVLGGEIEGGSGPAVYALGRSTLGLKGVMLRKGTYPVQLQPNVILSSLSGNTAFGYVAERSGIAVEGGLMGSSSDPQSRTWPGGDLSYIVLADLAIRGNQDTSGDRTSTLTIGGAGLPAEVRFDAGAGLTIGQDSGQHPGFAGKLLAIGATFKGNTTSPSSGFWDGIYFADTATEGGLILDACVVEGAGGAGSNGAVAVNGTSLVLRNGTAIRATGNVGLWLSASTVTVATATGGEIEGGSGPAVQALGRSTLSLSDVALRGGTYPVRIQPNVILAALGSNTATGYPPTRAGIAVESGLMGNSSGPQSRTWPGGDLSYIVLGGIEIRGDQDTSGDRLSTLVIGAPTEVRFDAGAGLSIGRDLGQHPGYAGQLQATGARFRGNTETTSPGFWKGIYFADTATAGGVLDACAVEDAGGAGSAGAVAVNATSLELRNGTVIRATGNVGLHLSASDFTAATVTGGEIQGGSGPAVQALGRSILSLAGVTLRNGTYPVQIQPNVILTALNGNTAAGYDPARNGIAVESGVMGGTAAQSRTWPGNDLPYIVLGDLSVRGDQSTSGDRTSTLIIGSPTEVRFSSGAGLFIGDDSGIEGGHWGRLQATGVMFTASSATPVPGFWKGIYFGDQALDGAANTFLDACSVEWAGGDVAGAVRINASAPVFKNGVTVRNTATAGVHLSSSTASNASILDGEIEGGADAAMRAAGSSTLLLRDVTLRGGPYPVRIDPNVNVAGLRGSRAEGYPFDRAAVAVESGVMGSSSGSQTRVWPAADLPFLILGNVEVRGTQNTGSDRTSTLVLQGGGEVRFERGTGLQIGDDSGIDGGHWGALRASGVTFTANTLSPVPGFWDGIYFADQMRDDLSFLYDGAVEYGGASGGNVLISRSSPYLSGVVVRGSGQDGVLASNSNSVLTGSHLTGNSSGIRLFYSGSLSLADSDVESNARFGAFNGAPPSLFARFNWWGDPSGPLDPVSNPGGLGDRVAERVDYASWLTASPLPPLAPASVTAQPGDGTVGLAWSANPEKDVTGYKIYRRLPPATAWTLRTSSPVPASASPSFQESGLTNRIGHCYQVRAMDGQGREGDPSREACATPKVDVTPPAWIGPAGALFAEGGDGQGVVRFEPAADASSTAAYDLYYSTVSPVDRSLSGTGRIANVTPVPSSAGHTLEVTVPGLLNGRRYFFNVQAVDSEGNEDGNAAEATAVIGPGSGAVVAASPWTGATLDGVEIDGQGRAVLTSGRTEGQITSAVVELPAGADLSAITWNAVQPAGTAVDTVPGGALTLEVRAADDPAHLADARCIAPSGLAAWWPGDGNGRDVQAGQDGAVRGGTGFAAGRSASAFRFDGIDDRVEIPNFGSFTRFTTQAWVYREGATNTRESLISYKETGCGFVFSLNEDGTSQRPRLWVYVNSVWRFAEGALPIPLERWTHLAGSYDGQEIRVYVDGVLAAATPAVGNMTQCNQRVALGARSSFDQHFFPGRIDEAAIFDRALTVAQIQALSAAGGSSLCKSDADGDGVADLADACPATPARIPVDIAGCPGGCFGPPANRVSWWRGEGNAADSAGTKAGTLVGGTTFDLGKVGQAFRFDGVDDRVEIPNLGSFTQITAQAWVYREGATNTRESLVSYELGCGIVLSLNENGVSQLPRLWVNVNGSWQFAEGTQPFPFGRWTHLAGTYDGQEIRLYVDGALAAVTPAVGNMTQCNEKVALGSRRSFDQYFFPGRLDEVTIFDRALSASEIQALAAAGSAGMCATAPPPSGVPAGTPQVQQGWAQVTPNQPFDLPDGRYVQVRITLRGDGTKSPALRSVSLGYRGGG